MSRSIWDSSHVEFEAVKDSLSETLRILGKSHDIFGVRLNTEVATDEACQLGCLAPGSSPHRHTNIVGYTVITTHKHTGVMGITEFGLDGMGVRDSLVYSV